MSAHPPHDETPDAEAIARVLAGDGAHYPVLVARYQEPLFRIAYAMVRDSDVGKISTTPQ